MIQGENSTVVHYELRKNNHPESPKNLRLEIRPLIAFRDYHSTTHENGGINPGVEQRPGLATVAPYEGLPSLHLAHNAAEVGKTGAWYRNFEYDLERERGLDFPKTFSTRSSCVSTCVPPPGLSDRVHGTARCLPSGRISPSRDRAPPGSGRILSDSRQLHSEPYWRRGPIHRLPRGPEDGYRRLSLVQRLGSRRHDRAARSHVVDRKHEVARSILRTFAQHVDQACCRTVFLMLVRRPNTRGRCHPLVLRSGSRLPRLHRRHRVCTDGTLRRVCRHHLLACSRYALRNQSGSSGLLTSAKPVSAHMDGRQSRRLGHDTAPRQAGGDPGAVVQRPLHHGRLGP